MKRVEIMQDHYSEYFEIICLNPNVEYLTEDDDDEEQEAIQMECEEEANVVACSEIKNLNIGDDKTAINDYQNELNECQQSEMFIDNNNELLTNTVSIIDEDSSIVQEIKPRKKLNLEEYKIRRANKPASSIVENKNCVVLELCENIPDSLPPLVLPTDPRSIKTLLENQNQPFVMMEGTCNDSGETTDRHQDENSTAIPPDYEEIVLVSIECNTEVSISPNEVDDEDCEKKSSAKYLTNIVNSFQQNNSAKTILNSSSSLLSSINAVLSEKRSNSINDVKIKSDVDEHGENKVIMHLKKDRIRPYTSSCGIQTDITPLFPPLILSPSLIFNRIKNARNFRRKSSRSRSRSRSRSISPEPEYFPHHRRSNYKYSRSVNSSSMNSSEMDSSSDSDTSTYSSCRSSDHDSLKRYDNRFKHGYHQRPNYNYQEERKIIYVGGLLEETTKDELRRKFLKYGTIKKISLHVKDDGSLRYGFVTFAESSAAYDVLDRFSTDPAICNFDLRFGGRRKFCRQTYADLDSINQEVDEYNNNNNNNDNSPAAPIKAKTNELSFEDLLNMTKRKLCKN